MYWVNFLHIYQPPTQDEEIIRKVTLECYRPLMRILKKYKSAKVTLNINACLTEHLVHCGFRDVVDNIGELAQEGRIELTASAKYHPILPLIPRSEVERQIELNQKSNERYFKGAYHPKGFYSPEMCYSKKIAAVVKAMGFEWMMADEIAYNGKLGCCHNDRLYTIGSLAPLKVFFKERRVSTAIVFGRCQNKADFMDLNKDIFSEDVYLLTGTDGEMYGHHWHGQGRLLEEVFQDGRIENRTVSQLKGLFLESDPVEPVASSWSSWEDEVSQGIPYLQWNDPANEIHQRQWELASLAMGALEGLEESLQQTSDWYKARCLLDQSWHSCQWWWASASPWWGPRMVQRGADMLNETVLSLKTLGLQKSILDKASALKDEIYQLASRWDSTGKAKDIQAKYLNSHREISSLLNFG